MGRDVAKAQNEGHEACQLEPHLVRECGVDANDARSEATPHEHRQAAPAAHHGAAVRDIPWERNTPVALQLADCENVKLKQ